MAVNPINFSRVSENLRTLSLLDSLRSNTLSLFAEQNRLATGNRLNAPSDDPVLAGRALNYTEVLDRQEQILNNIRHADSFLANTDNSMNDITDLLRDATGIANYTVNSLISADERASQAVVIDSIIDQLVQIGNRQFNGVYVFGGRATLTPPFSQQLGGVAYVGDPKDLTTDVGGATDAIVNLTGDVLFGMTTGQIRGYRDLEPSVAANTRLTDLAGASGLGVRASQIQIRVNGAATVFTVNLSGADDVGDVVDAINAAWTDAGGAGVMASLGPSGIQLTTGGAGDLEVREVGTGTAASDLGILGSDAGGTIAGGNLHARITETTPVAALAGGTLPALGSLRISNGGKDVVVDLSTAQTVEDVLNKINSAGVGVRAVINSEADGIDLLNLVSGTELRVTETGGTTADTLGLLSLSSGGLLSDLNHGDGVRASTTGADFRITDKAGISFDVSVNGLQTVQDLLDAINNAATAAGASITASLNPNGSGIRFDDTSGGAGPIRVERLNQSFAIDDLGLNVEIDPAATSFVSDDVAGVQADSVFTALLKLSAALRANDTQGINEAGQALERFLPEMSRLRGIVGARSKAMTERVQFTEDAVQATRSLLSEVKDLDYTEAVTKFQQAQTALQANLLTGSRLLTISLLDYL